MQIKFKGKSINHLKRLPEQGFSNENYIFTLDKKTYLFRQFKLQDRDRQLEFEVQTLAYENDLAAKPFVLDTSNSYMICEFLEGHHKKKLERADISLAAQTLKVLHSLKLKCQPLDLKSEFTVLDEDLESAFEVIDSVSKEIVLSHNDLNPKNCIFSNKDLKLIDWEFAGLNDRYFDLASISVEFSLDRNDEIYFMDLYFEKKEWNQKKLDAYKEVYNALCKKWFKENP